MTHSSDNLNDIVQSLEIFSLQPGHISLPGHQLLQADLTSYNMTVQSEATEKKTLVISIVCDALNGAN